ncbi:3'(2'),5'-bisphosphate nucleotidase [Chaetoceros tenuissimus]|uniref:3'(2'),5'-bisphosphate nucleotidase n=1 Tax=Chaetoceros tenuissimus TaxID=426638 RepID=A0AAD3CJ92_9STRA|nr:3'(2'),5'-bisphosphate nucleotidase [Chaetoceros tenuissimus]
MFDSNLTTIVETLITAAELCREVRCKSKHNDSMTKRDESPVTIADYGSQAIICQMLKEKYPNDPVVAEEDAFTLSSPDMSEQLGQVTAYVATALPSLNVTEEKLIQWINHGNGKPCKRFWTLDPIDGTKGFVRGDQYALCLALIEDGIVQLGLIACPALVINGSTGHLFIAKRGQGSYRQSLNREIPTERIYVNQECQSFVQSYEASHGNHSTQESVAKELGIENRINMDSQAKYCMVANGLAALYLRLSNYSENIWDHAAGALLVEEAGGKITDRDGKDLIYTSSKMNENNGVVVSNGFIHSKILSILKGRTSK